MRKHALFRSSVVASEDFLSMTTNAQAIYFQLLCETETDGEIVNVTRVVRGTGLSIDGLTELFNHGYLLEVAGRTYVRHNWVNNKLNQKVWKSMDSCEPYLNGQLEFEGTEGRSPYCLSVTQVTPDRKQGDTQVTPSSETCSDTETCNSTCTSTGTSTPTYTGEGDPQGEGGQIVANLHPCQCKKCGGFEAHYWQDGDRCMIQCPSCGIYEYDNHRTY